MSILPGWFPAGAAIGGAPPATSLSFQASATSQDSADLTAPADIQEGDLLLWSDEVRDNSTPSDTIPSGFTEFQNLSANGSELRARVILAGKIADGSEASATLTGSFVSSADSGKVLLVFRPNNPITSMVGFSGGAEIIGGGETMTPQTVTIGSNETPLVVFAVYSPIVATSSFSPSEDASVEAGDDFDNHTKYKIYNSSPQDTTVDLANDGGAVRHMLASVGVAVS